MRDRLGVENEKLYIFSAHVLMGILFDAYR